MLSPRTIRGCVLVCGFVGGGVCVESDGAVLLCLWAFFVTASIVAAVPVVGVIVTIRPGVRSLTFLPVSLSIVTTVLESV